MSTPALTDEERMIQEMARELAQRELAEDAARADREGRLPAERIAQLAESGLFGIALPAEAGGAGAGLAAACLAIEELAVGCPATAYLLAQQSLCGAWVCWAHGNEVLRERLVPALIEGGEILAPALGERGDQALARLPAVVARAEGPSRRLTGSKAPVPFGAYATHVLVAAREGDALFACVIPRPASLSPVDLDPLGLRATRPQAFALDDARADPAHALGIDSPTALAAALAPFRLGLAMVALGVAQAALAVARKHVGERRQFGQPIARFGAVSAMLADSEIERLAARAFVLETARAIDAGEPSRLAAAAAKRLATGAALRAADRAIQVHGGYGYCRDYGVERHYRDAQQLELELGSGEEHRALVARELLA